MGQLNANEVDIEDATPARPALPPRIALRASLLAVLFVLVVGAAIGVTSAILQAVTGLEGFTTLAGVVATAVAFPAAGAVAVVSVGLRLKDYLWLAPARREHWIAATFLGAGIALLNMVLTVRLLSLFDFGYSEMMIEMFRTLRELITPIGVWILMGLAVPVGEELLFRGVILRSLLDRWSTGRAVLVSALVFGLFHLHPVHGLIAFLLGLAAGAAMVATGSLWAAVGVHAVNNTLATTLAFVQPEMKAAPLWTLAPAAGCLGIGAWLLRRTRRGVP